LPTGQGQVLVAFLPVVVVDCAIMHPKMRRAKAALVMDILVHAVVCKFLLIVQLVNAGVVSADWQSGWLRASQRRAAECPPYLFGKQVLF